jgi:ABC-type branched-subunit amino acid transport system permease subunit
VRGVNLAVTTLATAAAMDALLFNNTWFSGGYTGRNVQQPHLLGLNLGIVGKGHDYPRVLFGVLVVVVVALVGLFVARMRNGRLGRSFLAVRSNERAAASIGIDVARTKLFAFGIAAFIAGIGGGLLAYQQQNVNSASFTLWTSLTILAITYVGGVGRITGALAAGALLASNGVVPTLLDNLFNFGQYQALIAGVALTLTAVANPDGMTKEMGAGLTKLRLAVTGAAGRRVSSAPTVPDPATGPPKVAGR